MLRIRWTLHFIDVSRNRENPGYAEPPQMTVLTGRVAGRARAASRAGAGRAGHESRREENALGHSLATDADNAQICASRS